MSEIANPIDTVSDRVQLPFSFDAVKMQEEMKVLMLDEFVYYDSLPLRAPAHIVDSSLPIPPPAEDYADGSWTDWMDTPLLGKLPYISSVIDFFHENAKVNLVRLLRLAPQALVKEHTDPTLGLHIERSVIRLTIPIVTNDNVEFFLNNSIVSMKPGECWYLRLTDPHRINNTGSTERINMTIDMIPNEWITSAILESK